jgi:hypothetical protein
LAQVTGSESASDQIFSKFFAQFSDFRSKNPFLGPKFRNLRLHFEFLAYFQDFSQIFGSNSTSHLFFQNQVKTEKQK